MTQYGRACDQSVPLIHTMFVLLLLFLFRAFKCLLIKLVVVLTLAECIILLLEEIRDDRVISIPY
jgi:hypothetical protein